MTTMVKTPPPARRYRPLSIGEYERLSPAARDAYDHAEESYLRERAAWLKAQKAALR
jgi:hypothetical protein